MYTLIFDFNDTISPSNFIQVIGEYEDKIGTSAISFIERYVNAGLLSDLLIGKYKSEVDFWVGVSELTQVDLQVLLAIRQEVANTKTVDTELLELIYGLRKKSQLVLLTDNLLETFDYWVEKFSLNKYFHYIANSATHHMLKSNPSFYSQVLEQINSQPEQSVLIDDHQGNLDIALSLGMKVILFTGVDDLKSKLLHLGVVVEK
jgi:HAD superfamily hydrolase (TIGR01509 family)